MKRGDFLFLLISSVILVISWIVFTIIHQSVTSTISETVASDILPIPGTFDIQTINTLKNRPQISPVYAYSSASAQPTGIPTPTLSFAQTIGTGSSQVATSGGSTK